MDLSGLGKKKGFRPTPIQWREAPNDIRELGFKAMLVLYIPVKREWSEAKRTEVAQAAAQGALNAVQTHEDAV